MDGIGTSPILNLSSSLKFTKIYDYSISYSANSLNLYYITPQLSNDITLTSSPYIALITHFTSMTMYTTSKGLAGYVIIRSGAVNADTANLCKINHNTTSTSIDLPYSALTFDYGKSFFDMAMNGLLYWPDFSYEIAASYAGIRFTAEVLLVSLS